MHVASIHSYPVKGCYRLDHDAVMVEPWGIAGDRRWAVVDAGTGQVLTQRDHARLTQVRPSVWPGGGLVLRAPDLPDLVVVEPLDGEPVKVAVWTYTGIAARAGKTADDWLTTVLAHSVRLVWLDDPTRRTVDPAYGQPEDTVSFADGYPLLLANQSSLDALNALIVADHGVAIPMTRFRPNVVVAGAPPWAEDEWLGQRLRLGDLTMRVAKSCGRCVVATTDQDSGERGREPLRTLARHRRQGQRLLFGIYLIPDDIPPGGARLARGDAVEPC